MSRIILHIDLNTFFVRIEEIKDPSLVGKPVAIGHEGRGGIISTCSYEARKYGVHSGMPTFQATQLCKNLILKDPDSEYIHLYSNEFFSYLRNFSKKIQVLGCDECFVDITEEFANSKEKNIDKYLKNIQDGLYKKTKLKCSIGVAPTKFLAKMGSDYKKPMGITIIRKKDVEKLLFPLDIKDFYGIGKQTTSKLKALGINTIGELYKICKENPNSNDITPFIKDYVISSLEGKTSDKLDLEYEDPKSIGTTRTLPYNSHNKEEIRKFYIKLVDSIIEKLKKEHQLTKTITLTLKDADCATNFKTKTYSKSLNSYTDNEEKIKTAALSLYDKVFKDQEIRLIGFTVKNLINKHNAVTQMTFDDYMYHEKESETYLLINEINRKFNKEVVKRASDVIKKK